MPIGGAHRYSNEISILPKNVDLSIGSGARGLRGRRLRRATRATLAGGVGIRDALRRSIAALGLLALRHGLIHAVRLGRRAALETELGILIWCLRHCHRCHEQCGDDA